MTKDERIAELEKQIKDFNNFIEKWHFENFERFEKHYNYLMTLKNREQLMVENEAMKETIAIILGQKKTTENRLRHEICEKIRTMLQEESEWYKEGFYIEMPLNDILRKMEKIEEGEE